MVKPLGKGKDSEDFVPPTATVSPIVANTSSAKKLIQVRRNTHFYVKSSNI